jgi:hypothetical protein
VREQKNVNLVSSVFACGLLKALSAPRSIGIVGLVIYRRLGRNSLRYQNSPGVGIWC